MMDEPFSFVPDTIKAPGWPMLEVAALSCGMNHDSPLLHLGSSLSYRITPYAWHPSRIQVIAKHQFILSLSMRCHILENRRLYVDTTMMSVPDQKRPRRTEEEKKRLQLTKMKRTNRIVYD